MSLFGKYPPNIEYPAELNPHRPPFVPQSEQQEATLATADWIIERCEQEIERLRALKPQTGGVS